MQGNLSTIQRPHIEHLHDALHEILWYNTTVKHEPLKPWKRGVLIGVIISLMLGAFNCGLTLAPTVWIQVEVRQARSLMPPLGEAMVYLRHTYYGPVPDRDTLTRGAITGMLEVLDDPYARVLEPQNNVTAAEIFTGKYGDIGVTLVWNGGWRLAPYPDGPAARAGVTEGDLLRQLDGRTLEGQSRADIEAALIGPVGSVVTLALERAGQPLTVQVAREALVHPSVSGYLLTADIGYMRITSITEATADECRAQLKRWPALRGLILDLRGNVGGAMTTLPELGGIFLSPGSVLYHMARRSGTQAIQVLGKEAPFTGRLVVLIDGQTASAAEVISAALQDHQRAFLIGQASAGKARMQLAYPLANGLTVVLTTAAWESPLHRSVEGTGVLPDAEVSAAVAGEDVALQEALTYLQKR